MKVSARVLNRDQLVVIVPPDVPQRTLREWGEDIAKIVDERIATDFENERGAGKALGGVSEEHEQRKAVDGLDLRKGHMHGDLQDALDRGGYRRVSVRRGRIDIEWLEQDLYADVPHAEPYAEAKVRGGLLLAVLKRDAQAAEQYLRARLRDLARAA
jgi:hypothetical protein